MLPRTHEAWADMARSTTAGEEGPLEIRSPAKMRWSVRASYWTSARRLTTAVARSASNPTGRHQKTHVRHDSHGHPLQQSTFSHLPSVESTPDPASSHVPCPGTQAACSRQTSRRPSSSSPSASRPKVYVRSIESQPKNANCPISSRLCRK